MEDKPATDYFPPAHVVYESQQKRQNDEERKYATQGKKVSLKEVGVGDEAIDKENMATIDQMSQEEILAAQKSIMSQLGATHLNALKKFQNNFGQGKKKA